MAEPPSSTGFSAKSAETETEVLGGAKPVEPAREPRAPLVGRTLGRFAIVERLGRGGSGEVFRAEQAQLGRSAVVKVLRSDLAPSPHRVERFLREARLASTLDHPYAAHIYAFGAEPDGVLWIAMEHVRGTTLDEVVARRGPIPPAVFAPLFERLCEVVHSAHERGIVHRDIKLANVMVIERSGQLLPKLLDFGIAKAGSVDDGISPGGGDAADLALTGHGATIGSPPYMAPEQWQRPHDVDGRADIYALGVLAYRCLSGRPPIPGTSRAELAHAHLHVEPRPLGVGPPALDEAIRRALAKAPDQRWPRALDFAAAVRKAVGAGAGEAVPLLDGLTRDVWEKGGPQPIAEAVARVAATTTTVECDDAVRDLIDVTCRWLAAIALAGCKPEQLALVPAVGAAAAGPAAAAAAEPASDEETADASAPAPRAEPIAVGTEPEPEPEPASPLDPPTPSPFARPGFKRAPSAMTETSAVTNLRERARELGTRDDAAAWLAVARAACAVAPALPELPGVLAAARVLDGMAVRYAAAGRRRRTPADLAADVGALAEALAPLEPLLAYRLVIGGADGPETWVGARARTRPRALVWGDAVAVGEVVLLDGAGHIALRLSPLVRAQRPLPHADLELFLIARTGRGVARLAATPWGFEHDDEEAGRFLAQLSTADSQQIDDIDDEASPYPGLAAYGVADADRFFGREREIDALANRLVRAPMVAVVGPSGVGKSSFVHAGLVARLREHYRVITLRPGRRPAEALAAALDRDRAAPAPPAELADRLRAAGDGAARGAVVIVDQLEELVTLCDDAAERDRFARALAAAADASTAPVRVVATLRDDFASLLESIDGFRDHYEVFVLGAPSPDALRRILVEPARRAGVGLEPGLVDDIVTEIAGRPAALPLLGFTAARLWQLRDRDRRLLTRAAYPVIGGVAGALASYADEVFGRLGKREQSIARDIFARLVAADGTRVPMPRAELATLDGGQTLDHLIDARLLVARDGDGDGDAPADDLIELVHECLAERWPRLVRWRSEDAADRALIADLRTAARRWDDQRRPDDLLWRGAVLADLRRLAARATGLTAREREFATASLAAARRRTRLRRAAVAVIIAGLAAVAGVMAYLMKVADDNAVHAAASERTARTAADLAESRLTHQLRSAGQRELVEGRPVNALAYLGEVLRRGLDDDGIRLMIGQSSWAWPHERGDRAHDQYMAATEDGTWIAVGHDGGRARWTALDGRGAELATFDTGTYTADFVVDRRGARAMFFNQQGVHLMPLADPARRKLVIPTTGTDDVFTGCFGPAPDELTMTWGPGRIRVYGTDGAMRRETATGIDEVGLWECSPDGTHLLIATATQLRLFDTRSLEVGYESTANYVTADFAADGTFALDTADGQLEVHAPGGAPIAHWTSVAGPHLVEMAPDGRHVAIGGDRAIELRRLTDGHVVSRMAGFRGGVAAMRFDGDELWSGGNDGIVRRWNRAGLQLAELMSQGGAVDQLVLSPAAVLAFSERGVRAWAGRPSQLVTAPTPPCVADYAVVARQRPLAAVVCSEGRVELYDFTTATATTIRDPREQLAVAMSPDGTRLATWMWNGGLTFWTAAGEKINALPTGTQIMSGAWVGDEVWTANYVSGGTETHDLVIEVVATEPATASTRTLAFVPTEDIVQIDAFARDSAVLLGQSGALTTLRDGATIARVETGLTTLRAPRMSVAAHGGFVAVGGTQGTIRIYTLPDLREVHRIDAPGAVGPLSLDPDARTLVTVASDRRAILWSVATGEALTQLPLGEVPVLDAQYSASPDELFVYAGDQLSRITLPRAPGTTAELAAQLACRVPLRPEGGALVATTPTCDRSPRAPTAVGGDAAPPATTSRDH